MTPEDRDRLEWEYGKLAEEEYRRPYAAVWCGVVALAIVAVGLLWMGISIWRAL